jgi:tRNA(Ile2) C34 agmatinyltransferase TiaS
MGEEKREAPRPCERCGATMVIASMEMAPEGNTIHYRCKACGAEKVEKERKGADGERRSA